VVVFLSLVTQDSSHSSISFPTHRLCTSPPTQPSSPTTSGPTPSTSPTRPWAAAIPTQSAPTSAMATAIILMLATAPAVILTTAIPVIPTLATATVFLTILAEDSTTGKMSLYIFTVRI